MLPSTYHSEKLPHVRVYEQERENSQDEIVEKIAAMAIRQCIVVDDLSQKDRMPHNSNGDNENDAEHSLAVGMTAAEIARKYYPELDLERIWAFAAVHDLVEIKVGDVATFNLTPEQLQEKERREHAAIEELYEELLRDGLEGTAADLKEYEAQATPEARFVRAVDKLMPIAKNIASKDMSNLMQDYGITNVESLRKRHDENIKKIHGKFGEEFPVIVAAYAYLCRLLEDRFSQALQESQAIETPKNPINIEFTYRIDSTNLPEWLDLSAMEQKRIIEACIDIHPDGSTVWVRNINDTTFEYVSRSAKTSGCDEKTIPFQRADLFEDSLRRAHGQPIQKTRYTLPMQDGAHIEIDVHNEDYAVAKVTFPGRPSDASIKAATFKRPDWFGEDISEDPNHTNHHLALHGIPSNQ